MNDVKLLIDRNALAAQSGRLYQRIDSVRREVANTAAAVYGSDVHLAVQSAAVALDQWTAMGSARRRELLLSAADCLASLRDEFIQCMISETGAAEEWAEFNVAIGVSLLREAASIPAQITDEAIPTEVPNNVAMAIREPVGVCVSIASSCTPVVLGVRAIAVPLACGNTVVFKASENCPAVHRLIGTALLKAGVPPGVLNILTNDPADTVKVVEALIDHPLVRHINFTGSIRVGRIIAERAARHLKPVLLELRGMAPLVVLDDADLAAAVDAASFDAFSSLGRIHMSTRRIVADSKIADEFVARLAAKAVALQECDRAPGPTVPGSRIDEMSATRMNALIGDAWDKGAHVVMGGTTESNLLPAAVLDFVTPQMRIYSEESFGPIAAVIRVEGDEEALRVANDTGLSLSAAVFSQDPARALRVARRIQSGFCHINGPAVHDGPRLGFDAVKAYGYGRFGGRAAIDEFTITKCITTPPAFPHHPL